MRYLLFLLLFPSIALCQQIEIVDFTKIEATILCLSESQTVNGNVVVNLTMLQDSKSIYLDAINFYDVELEDNAIDVVTSAKRITLNGDFKSNKNYSISFSYKAKPKQALYFTGDQIWTQGQGKYTSHWLPSIDDMNDKIEFDISHNTSRDVTVVANGELQFYDDKPIDRELWNFDMQKPMSSYLVAFAIGNFHKKIIQSTSGVPIELYYKPEDSLKVEPTYRYTKEIFDFFEDEIGVAYPWQNYKQVPVRDFLYAGMENTGCTIFSEAFVVDSVGFNDRNYVNVNAHELAHQWFGNLLTETSGTHHWLQEGFATYYALLAEKEIFGEEYYYWKLYNTAEQLKALSEEGKGESLLNPKASSLTFYEKGAWALHILKEIIGEVAFKKAIKSYLEKHAFKNVSTEDFLTEVRAASDVHISQWEQDWLQQTAFKAEQAYKSLIKSPFINRYFEIAALRGTPLEDKIVQLDKALTFPNDFIGQEVIYQLYNEPITETEELYQKGIKSNNLFVRQAISQTLETIPPSLKESFISLLNDESYVTLESTLIALWQNYPEERVSFLEKTKNIEGFQNKNIKQLWLALALLTDGYNTSAKSIYKKELQNYTSATYSFEIRQKAFEYVNRLRLYNENVLKNLVNACVHHNWRFRNTARDLLTEVLKDQDKLQTIKNQLSSFSEKEKEYLNRVLK